MWCFFIEIASAWGVPAISPLKYELPQYERPVKKFVSVKIKKLDQHPIKDIIKHDPELRHRASFSFRPTEGITKFLNTPKLSSQHQQHPTNFSYAGKDNDKKHQVTAWTEWSVKLPESYSPLLNIEHEQEAIKQRLEKPSVSKFNQTKKDDKHSIKNSSPFYKTPNGDSNILTESKLTSHEMQILPSNYKPIENKNITKKSNNLNSLVLPTSFKSLAPNLMDEQGHHTLKFKDDKEDKQEKLIHNENSVIYGMETKYNQSKENNEPKEIKIQKAQTQVIHNYPLKRQESISGKSTSFAEMQGEQKTPVLLISSPDHKRG